MLVLLFFLLWKNKEGAHAMQGKQTNWTVTLSFPTVVVYGKGTLRVVAYFKRTLKKDSLDNSRKISFLSC